MKGWASNNMRDWAFGLMIGLIFISFAGCAAVERVAHYDYLKTVKQIEQECK
jgi:hypothetical protein